MLQPTQTHCVTCDVSLRYSKPKHCPEPEIIRNIFMTMQAMMVTSMSTMRSAMHAIEHDDKLISSDADLEEFIITLLVKNQLLLHVTHKIC